MGTFLIDFRHEMKMLWIGTFRMKVPDRNQ
uniref:Uncharacterized protein n=1 Tax=Arundo donax TaxID=35708 RepID=A0A0A8ZSE7_ARUDO